MVKQAPIRADMRDPRNERFFSRVWERFFAELPQEIENVSYEDTGTGGAMANYFADQLEKLIESIPPQADYSHQIEALEKQQTVQSILYLNRIEALESSIASLLSDRLSLLHRIEELENTKIEADKVSHNDLYELQRYLI